MEVFLNQSRLGNFSLFFLVYCPLKLSYFTDYSSLASVNLNNTTTHYKHALPPNKKSAYKI